MSHRETFITLATDDAYCMGALTWAASLRQVQTNKEISLMITRNISAFLRPLIEKFFDNIFEVDVINNNDSHGNERTDYFHRQELSCTFTKLHCWTFTEFYKGVFMDADTVVLHNVDELFDYEELSAVPDPSWPDCFNSGVFVFRPSLSTFTKLLELGKTGGSFDGGDQGLLNTYFGDWLSRDISRRLSYIYNCICRINEDDTFDFYTSAPAWVKFGAAIRVAHFAGPIKPWHRVSAARGCSKTACLALLGAQSTRRTITRTNGMLAYWWSLFLILVRPHLPPDAYLGDVSLREEVERKEQHAGFQHGTSYAPQFSTHEEAHPGTYIDVTFNPPAPSQMAPYHPEFHETRWDYLHCGQRTDNIDRFAGYHYVYQPIVQETVSKPAHVPAPNHFSEQVHTSTHVPAPNHSSEQVHESTHVPAPAHSSEQVHASAHGPVSEPVYASHTHQAQPSAESYSHSRSSETREQEAARFHLPVHQITDPVCQVPSSDRTQGEPWGNEHKSEQLRKPIEANAPTIVSCRKCVKERSVEPVTPVRKNGNNKLEVNNDGSIRRLAPKSKRFTRKIVRYPKPTNVKDLPSKPASVTQRSPLFEEQTKQSKIRLEYLNLHDRLIPNASNIVNDFSSRTVESTFASRTKVPSRDLPPVSRQLEALDLITDPYKATREGERNSKNESNRGFMRASESFYKVLEQDKNRAFPERRNVFHRSKSQSTLPSTFSLDVGLKTSTIKLKPTSDFAQKWVENDPFRSNMDLESSPEPIEDVRSTSKSTFEKDLRLRKVKRRVAPKPVKNRYVFKEKVADDYVAHSFWERKAKVSDLQQELITLEASKREPPYIQPGIAGNLRRMELYDKLCHTHQREESERMYAWERGEIDYMGEDRFVNILTKICATMRKAGGERNTPAGLEVNL